MIPSKSLEIELNLPKPPSLNAYFNSKHWAIKVKYKKEYTKYCEEQIALYDEFTCDTYEIHIRYNSRHDVDNVILVSKFLSDTLVDKGVVKDDGNKYYKRLNIQIDKELPKDAFLVKVKCQGVKEKYDE
jgi:Holliday junction resolvase RusA-like endonuclease